MSNRRAPATAPRTGVREGLDDAHGAAFRDYSVLLGLVTVGTVLFLHSIGARLTSEWHAVFSTIGAVGPAPR